MRVARVQAQAKINLMLRVFPTRDVQGYHELHTIFHRIDLADEIVVRAGGTGRSIDCSGPRMPASGLGPAEQNLAYRAAVEFAGRSGWPEGFAIEVTKHIPVGGGLGGGSADAGAVLRALNALAPQPISAEEVWSAGCFLGSDVPFLASDLVTAIGMGSGTQLSDGLKSEWPQRHVLIVVPPFGISTGDAYGWVDADRERFGWSPLEALGDYAQSIAEGDLAATRRKMVDVMMINDFERSVESRHPQIRRIRERLMEKGAEMARLAGSGSCVFGLFDNIPPTTLDLDFDVLLIPSRLSTRVVQVEVLE